MTLTTRILLAMAFAIVLGTITFNLLAMPDLNDNVRYVLDDMLASGLFALIGKIFVSSLKVLVVPLVFVSLVCGVCHLSDQSSLGRMSLKTVVLYLVTTAIAISAAMTLANIVNPGIGIDMSVEAEFSAPEVVPLIDVLANIFPTNPFQAMAEGNMLQVIVFAILVGLAIGRSGVPGERIGKQFSDWNEILMTLVTMLMNLAPYGVFALLFSLFASKGLGPVQELLAYMFTVVAVLLVHGIVVYSAMLRMFAGVSPVTFLKKMWPVQIFAFSTASSSATLPVTIKNAEQNLGVGTRAASFVLPLGATINMAGAAITISVITLAAANTLGIPVDFGTALLLCVVSALAACGVSGVAGGSLLLIPLATSLFGISTDIAMQVVDIGFVISVVQDSTETALNSSTDVLFTAAACRAAERKEG